MTVIVWDSGDIKGHPGCNNKARRNKEEDRERKEGVFAEGTGSESWNWETLWEGQKVNDAVENKNPMCMYMCIRASPVCVSSFFQSNFYLKKCTNKNLPVILGFQHPMLGSVKKISEIH